MSQLGRISGRLLQDNLLRDGVDLSFKNSQGDTALLYLDVTTKKIGVNVDVPSRDLEVAAGSTLFTSTTLATQATISNYDIVNNQINVSSGNTTINSNELIRSSGVRVDYVELDDTTISTRDNQILELRPDQDENLETVQFNKITGDVLNQELGNSIATGDDFIVVGVDYGLSDVGPIYVYELVGSSTIKSPTETPLEIISSDIEPGDRFGFSVSASSELIAVGAPEKNNQGVVYTYEPDGTNEDAYSSIIDNSKFGFSVANTNDWLVIGAPGENTSQGAVYIEPQSFGVGPPVKITASDGAQNDNFGYSVAIYGQTVVIGAPDHNGEGAVYIYDTSGANEVKLTASDIFTGDRFGHSVSIFNNLIVVGAPKEDAGGPNAGSVYIYDIDNAYAETKITASDAAGFDQYGTSVFINSQYIVVGSPQSDNPDESTGSIYVYDTSGSNEIKISPNDLTTEDRFGNSVVVGADKIIAGAYRDSELANRAGSVYVFDLLVKGTLEVHSNLDVFANLYASENIVIEGNIELGDEETDTITFEADVNSDIVPDVNGVGSLGAQSQRWQTINSVLMNGEDIQSQVFVAGDVDIGTIQGNMFYVSVNGSDTARGDHPQGPFRTLKHALATVDPSTLGPVTVLLFPGEYEEEFPLEVPSNVSVRGTDIRNTIVKPTVASQDNDAFLLNGETTIEDLTIKDFYYNSINDTGYAFRFANDAVITSRSPYVRNITVITKGSVTDPVLDPRGFDAGDAGKGALIDGSVVGSSSNQASMLFHSATFITPGVNCITMTNGVRVEWLNSFTYFANRGLYALQGSAGFASEGTVFGAEIRSIGSASVYGNFGAVADGADTLMYLIGHNLAYIGVGKDVSNDGTLVIQDNETVEINSGKIYFTSTDARGTFRVGDAFFVDFDRGTTSIGATGVDLSGITRITISGPGEDTVIDSEKIDIGNIRINGNTVQSISGDIVFSAASGTTRFTNDVTVEKNVTMTGDLTFDGSLIRLGDQPSDTVAFETQFDQDLKPNSTGQFNLGSFNKRWKTVDLSELTVDGVSVSDNTVRANSTNENLELLSNSAGNVKLSEVTFRNNQAGTYSANLVLHSLGNVEITGTGSLIVSRGTNAQRNNNIGDVRFNTEDSVFEGYNGGNTGFGGVYSSDRSAFLKAHPSNNTLIGSINGEQVLTVSDTVALQGLQVDDVRINDNTVRTNVSNSNLELLGDRIVVDSFSVDSQSVVYRMQEQFGSVVVPYAGYLDISQLYVIQSNFFTAAQIYRKSDGELLASVENQNRYPAGPVAINDTHAFVGSTPQFTNNTVKVFDAATGTEIQTISNPEGAGSFGGTIASNNMYTAIVDPSNSKVFVYNSQNFALLHSLSGFFQVDISESYLITTGNTTAYIYDILSGNLLHTLSNPDPVDWGTSVSISESYAIIGADRQNDAGGDRSGKAYIFDVTDGSLLHTLDNPNIRESSQGDNFGHSVAISDTYAIVGALFDIETGADTGGAVHIYDPITGNLAKTLTSSDKFFVGQDSAIFNNFVAISDGRGTTVFDIRSLDSIETLDVIHSQSVSDVSTITNTSNDALVLENTNRGYVKVAGTFGAVVPAGDTAGRGSNAQLGQSRYNTETEQMEVYNGEQWIAAVGEGDVVTDEFLAELVDIYALVLG